MEIDRRALMVGAGAAVAATAIPFVPSKTTATFSALKSWQWEGETVFQLIDDWDSLVNLVGSEPAVHKMIATGQISLRSDLASMPYQVWLNR